MLAGCARGPEAPAPGRALDAEAEEARLLEATAVREPLVARLGWAYREGNFRFRGEGVLRRAPGPRARVDLFLRDGSTVLRAALVGDELRLPQGVRGEMVPSAPLLWGAFGVLVPGTRATLLGGSELADGERRLRYGLSGGEELHVRYRDARIVRVERVAEGRVLEEVSLVSDRIGPLPAAATYRRHREGRLLEVTVTSVEPTDAFPPSIWSPGD